MNLYDLEKPMLDSFVKKFSEPFNDEATQELKIRPGPYNHVIQVTRFTDSPGETDSLCVKQIFSVTVITNLNGLATIRVGGFFV